MSFVKVISGIFFIRLICLSYGQFLTPEQLREQYELGYSSQTHYEKTGSQRTDIFNRVNPDYLLDGFFPFWSIILIGFSLIFLLMAILGLIGYFLGLRRPSFEEIYANEFDQLSPDDEYLLGHTETKIPIQTASNDYFDRNQKNIVYESILPLDRTREHAV